MSPVSQDRYNVAHYTTVGTLTPLLAGSGEIRSLFGYRKAGLKCYSEKNPFPKPPIIISSCGLLVFLLTLERPVQRGSTYFEGTAYLRNGVLLAGIERLSNTKLSRGEDAWSAASSSSFSGCYKPCLGSLPNEVSLKLR